MKLSHIAEELEKCAGILLNFPDKTNDLYRSNESPLFTQCTFFLAVTAFPSSLVYFLHFLGEFNQFVLFCSILFDIHKALD